MISIYPLSSNRVIDKCSTNRGITENIYNGDDNYNFKEKILYSLLASHHQSINRSINQYTRKFLITTT